MRLASPWPAWAHAVLVLSTFMLGETTLSGNCQIELPYTMRASEKSTCHAALSSVQAAITAKAVFAQIQTNYTFTNTLKDSLNEPELVLPLPKTAILQGFAVHGLGNGLAGDVVLKSDVVLPAKCPSGDSFSFYQAALQGPRYRVPLASSIQSMQPGSQVVLQIDYVMQLKTKQRSGFGHTFALQVPLPAGTNKDTRSVSGSGPAVSIELVGESLELEVDVAATTPGVVVKRCPTGISNCYTVESPVLQDVALEIAMPKRGQTQANLYSPLTPLLTLQKHPATGQVAAALWLPPALDLGEGSMFEVFIVVDASATMRGPRLGRVQQALRSLLRSLPRGTRINIIGHDANKPLEPMFEESQRVDEKTFQEVDQHLAREPAALSTSGPMQSAEAVLGAVFDVARPASTQLRVLLITDRHPPDPKRAIQLVEESCSEDCRLFSAGLGWSASPMFVEDVARAGGGSFSYVAERDFKLGLEKALLSHLLDGLVPVIRDVNVSWGSLFGASLQLSLDLREMDFNSRLLSIALINPSVDEGELDLNKLKHLDIQAVVGGVHRSMTAFQLGMSTSTALHAAGVSLFAEDARESPQSLPENVQDAALMHRVATSATQWVFKASQVQQAVLCEGLPDSPADSSSASDTSNQRGSVTSGKDSKESIRQNSLSTRERQQAPLKQLGEKLSALDFGRFALSLSLKDDAVNQRFKSLGADSHEKLSERMDDWFRPRSSMFSVRGFSRAGSALSIMPGGSLGPTGTTGNKHSSSSWPGAGDPSEAWPFRHGRDKDFLAQQFEDVNKGSKTSKTPASSGSELVTRNTPSGRAKKAAGVVSRLSVLDFSMLGQRLSLQGAPGSRAQRSVHSRLESLSLFDSMMVGSGGSSASTGRKDAFKSRSQSLSLRSHIAISKIGASPSKHSSSWAKLSATGVFTLASQLSIRRPEKSFTRSRGPGPSYASFADLAGQAQDRQAGQAANAITDEVGGQLLSDSSVPAAAAAAEKEAEQPLALQGWISIEVAGGILQGVCPVRYASETCSDESEQVTIHWRPGRNASCQMVQVYLTTVPLISINQSVRLGEVSFPSASDSSDPLSPELLIGFQVSRTCELTVRSMQASGKHLHKLMTANLVAAAPQQFQGAPLQGPQPLELNTWIGEALVNRLGAVRRGFPTMGVAKAKAAAHASHGTAGSAAELAACHAILFTQTFQGYFVLEQATLETIGLSWDHLQLLASLWTTSTPVGVEVAHTTFALNVLTESFQEMQASWYLAARRAEAWLKQQVAGLSLPGCRNVVSCFETARIFAVRERQENGA
ncbi:unnamed protein product [Symbiodinium sp. CCMP2456]|nr:unnamed protein product [Symbiodinium sp. CCMP2456]